MTEVEDRLRQALAAEAEQAQPGALRPLRSPGSTRALRGASRLRRLTPLAAAAAVGAVIAGVFTASQPSTAPRPAAGATTVAPPPFYVTLSGKPGHLAAVVRDSHSGARLSSVPVPYTPGAGVWPWITAGSDRTFALAVPQGSAGEHFFLLRITASGRSGKLTALPVPPLGLNGAGVTGIALSPDGQKLAVTLDEASSTMTKTHGIMEVASTATGSTRTWAERSQYGYPFGPAWAGGGRRLGFGWYNHLTGGPYPSSKAQVRMLDTAAPGHDLLASRVIVPETAVPGVIQTAQFTPDGRTVIASVTRASPGGYGHGTVVARILTISAATGQVTATDRTVTIPYHGSEGKYAAEAACQVLSPDRTGYNILVKCTGLGRLGGRAFTPLHGTVVTPPVPEAAW